MAQEGGYRSLVLPTHGQPRSKGMLQGVLRDAFKPCFLDGGDKNSRIKVSLIQVGSAILRRKYPQVPSALVHVPNLQCTKNRLGLCVQGCILHLFGFGLRQCHQALLKIHIVPLHMDLFTQTKASQNGQPSPWRIDWTKNVQQPLLFFKAQKPQPTLADFGQYDAGKGGSFQFDVPFNPGQVSS